MEVYLHPDLQARLALLAAQQGRDSETLPREAIERLLTEKHSPV
jgi:predicted DNA-binding protein